MSAAQEQRLTAMDAALREFIMWNWQRLHEARRGYWTATDARGMEIEERIEACAAWALRDLLAVRRAGKRGKS